MTKFAVIRVNGKQYKVSEGEEILLDKLKDPNKFEPEVLLVSDDSKVKVGKPVVKDAKIKTKILSEAEKGEKLHVRTFKAKSRHRRHVGFRPQHTRILIEKIS